MAKNEKILDELLAELGDFRVGHYKGLENFDLNKCEKKEIVFLQIFENESFQNTFKILFSREDSAYQFTEINSKTGTPTPWTIYKEIIFFGINNEFLKIYQYFKKYFIGSKTYEITKSDILEILGMNPSIRVNSASNYSRDVNSIGNVIVFDRPDKLDFSQKIGFVYCFRHVRSLDRCKIGYTDRDPRIRAAETSLDAAMPEPYLPIFACVTHDAYALEKKMQERLEDIHIAKEYFSLDINLIISEFINEYDQGSICGFFVYEENEKYFSDLSFEKLVADHRLAQIEVNRDEYCAELKNKFQSIYYDGYKNIFFSKICELKYEAKLTPLERQRRELLIQRGLLEKKTKNYNDQQGDLTKGGAVLSGLGLAAFDGGMSLVPAAFTAAGLYFNKKKNDKKKSSIHSLNNEITKVDKLISEIKLKICSELVEQCEFLDDFFDITTQKVMAQSKTFSSSKHVGYLINLVGNNIIYSDQVNFQIVALNVFVNPPIEALFKDSIDVIRLAPCVTGAYTFHPYEDTYLYDKEKCNGLTKFLIDYAAMCNALIPLNAESLLDESKY
jgi:hypothetical protein